MYGGFLLEQLDLCVAGCCGGESLIINHPHCIFTAWICLLFPMWKSNNLIDFTMLTCFEVGQL